MGHPVYVPHSDSLALDILDKLETNILNAPPDALIVLAGDFNCTLLPDLDRKNSTEYRKRVHSHLHAMIQSTCLIDIWRDFNPGVTKFTFTGTNPSRPQARLDRFYINDTFLARTKSSNIHPTSFFSDHHPITLAVMFPNSSFKG